MIKESLRVSVGKRILIFLNNGFRFQGKIINCDDEFLKILDFKKNSEKFIRFSDISEAEVMP